MSLKTNFSSLVYNARKSKGYTQDSVAEAISVSVRWYQRIESGEKFPSGKVLVKLVLFLDINIEELREEVILNVPICSGKRELTFK